MGFTGLPDRPSQLPLCPTEAGPWEITGVWRGGSGDRGGFKDGTPLPKHTQTHPHTHKKCIGYQVGQGESKQEQISYDWSGGQPNLSDWSGGQPNLLYISVSSISLSSYLRNVFSMHSCSSSPPPLCLPPPSPRQRPIKPYIPHCTINRPDKSHTRIHQTHMHAPHTHRHTYTLFLKWYVKHIVV